MHALERLGDRRLQAVRPGVAVVEAHVLARLDLGRLDDAGLAARAVFEELAVDVDVGPVVDDEPVHVLRERTDGGRRAGDVVVVEILHREDGLELDQFGAGGDVRRGEPVLEEVEVVGHPDVEVLGGGACGDGELGAREPRSWEPARLTEMAEVPRLVRTKGSW